MKRRPFAAAAIVALLLSAFVAGLPRAWAGPRLAVIVHPERGDHPSVEELARIYLKQKRFWQDGSAIVPLNREAGNAAREAFSRRVLGSASAELSQYWNARFFAGVFPPATLSSDEAVRRYVAADAAAIGYIDATQVDGSVRVVLELP